MLRTRITWLAAALVAGVVTSFVIPLCLLMRTMAEERALSVTRSDAQGVAMIVASADTAGSLPAVVTPTLTTRTATTTVSLPSGQLLAGPASAAVAAEASRYAAEDLELLGRVRADNRSMAVAVNDRFHVLIPVAVDGGVAVVHAVTDLGQVTRGVYESWAILGAVGVLLVVASVLVARRLSERISTPVMAMADVAHRLRSGDFQARATASGPVEVIELGHALNQLADRIDELRRLEREGAADVSHRLRTPVTALRLDTDQVTDPVVRSRLRGHVEDLHRAIDSVVADARRPIREAMGARCEARGVVAERCRHWGPLAEDQGRPLTVPADETGDGPTAVLVGLAHQDLADLLDTLIDNVFAHTPEGAPIKVTLAVRDAQAVLTVEDGGGASPDTVALARGESGAGSTGLGLDIVRRLAADGGGAIHLGRSALGGLAVIVTLPTVAAV